MQKITFLLLLFTAGIFSQTIQMPDIPEDGIIYQTKTLNSAIPICSPAPPEPGDYIVQMYDGYGDGWQSDGIEVCIDANCQDVTLASGNFAEYTVSVPDGTGTLSWNWAGDLFLDEVFLVVYAPDGSLLFFGTGLPPDEMSLYTNGAYPETVWAETLSDETSPNFGNHVTMSVGLLPITFCELTDNWDFSGISYEAEVEVSMIPIENSSYSSSEYPNTTHVKSFLSGDQSVVQFPGFTSSGYTYNGENSIINNNYSTALTIMPYPFSVGDSHSDAVYDIPFDCAICPPEMYRDHEVTTQALGSGTVTMPDGSIYNNVVLVQHDAIFSDAQTGSDPCITARTSYFWWAEDLGIPLIETYSQVTYGACNFPSAQFTRFYAGDPLSTSDAEMLDMRIYPNPVNGNYVTIQSPIQGLKEVEVYTITGRKLLQTVLTDDQLDVSSFNSGFYMVKVTINGQSKLSKLVVR